MRSFLLFFTLALFNTAQMEISERFTHCITGRHQAHVL
uniref:Uncharacterized protein n=1 Tax=Anguilla anguilla TaxID=7936 RepID=A0A0E9QDK9_ANGAN